MPKKRSIESFDSGRRGCEVCQTRGTAAPGGNFVGAAEHAGMRRRSVPRPVVGEKLALEARDVDADGTLGLARAALEAEIEHLVHALVAESRFAELPAIASRSAFARPRVRMRLLPRRHVRRAHRAVELLAAGAEAAAHLDGAAHAAVLGVVEEGRRVRASRSRRRSGGCAVSGGESTILPGLKMPSGSNVCLIGPERLVEHRAEHLLHERTAHQPVAVLARQRAAELEDQIGDVVGDRLEAARRRPRSSC